MRAEEIAPGIWYVTGEGHHSVVVEFADHLTLSKRRAHCAAFLMVYLPKEKLLVEADDYQPPPLAGVPPRTHPHAPNLLDNIRRRGLRADRILPIRGRIVPFADLVAVARTAPLNTK